MTQEAELKGKKEKSVFFRTLALAWELGYSIAIPLVMFAISGKFIDKKYETSPMFLLLGIFLAIMVSGILVFKKTKKILEDTK